MFFKHAVFQIRSAWQPFGHVRGSKLCWFKCLFPNFLGFVVAKINAHTHKDCRTHSTHPSRPQVAGTTPHEPSQITAALFPWAASCELQRGCATPDRPEPQRHVYRCFFHALSSRLSCAVYNLACAVSFLYGRVWLKHSPRAIGVHNMAEPAPLSLSMKVWKSVSS